MLVNKEVHQCPIWFSGSSWPPSWRLSRPSRSGCITMWFVVGALVAFVADLLGANFVVQVALFLVVSVLCLVLLRPVVVKHRNRGHSAEPTLVGERGVVCEMVDNDGLTGRVELSDHIDLVGADRLRGRSFLWACASRSLPRSLSSSSSNRVNRKRKPSAIERKRYATAHLPHRARRHRGGLGRHLREDRSAG